MSCKNEFKLRLLELGSLDILFKIIQMDIYEVSANSLHAFHNFSEICKFIKSIFLKKN